MFKWITILFTLFILLVIVLANAGALGLMGMLNRIPFGDKAGHFLLYGTLSFLLNKSIIKKVPKRNPAHLITGVSLLLSVIIGIEEWSQSLFPARTMSLADLAASYAGVTAFALLAYRAR